MDRKAEIERKKARLAAMKEERKRKEDEKKKNTDVGSTSTASQGDVRENADSLLKQLGIAPDVSTASFSQSAVASPPKSAAAPGAAAPPHDVASQPQVLARKKNVVNLSASKVSQLSIPPRENVSYSKETQTVVEQYDKEDEDTDSMEAGLDTPPPPGKSLPPGAAQQQHRMPHVELAKPAETSEDVKPPKPPAIKEFTEEEIAKIMASEDFIRSFQDSSRIMERLLAQGTDDIQLNYAKDDADQNEGQLAEGEKLKLNREFFDERWSKHRTVTCMDWSTKHPELLVASYNNNEENAHEPDGVALIWNLKFQKTSPEYIFHCQSAVMSTCFAKFHPNLVVGGTYSGQIVLWDNRNYKRTPVQRTPLSAAAHTHPVYCVQVVGTQNAHNLISISTDGKICSWSLDMLAQPQDSMELQYKQTKAVSVMSTSFFSNDVNNYVIGSEEGVLYTACRHGSKAGIVDNFEGHQGPATGIHTNNVPGPIDFSPYFLSSSFDWSVKLWNAKDSAPLHTFEDFSDYVMDVKWSPIHPALFATVDSTGRLDIWNCNNDIEVPTASTCLENVAWNKCLWHQSGHHLAVGDDMGKVHIFDVGESLANPKPDEWSRFLQTLTEMKQNQEERAEDRHVSFMKAGK